MSVYLITGVSGYIGSMLAKYLLENQCGSEVVALVRYPQKTRDCLGIKSAEMLKRIDFFQADLCDSELADRFCREKGRRCVDYVIHCAAVTDSHEMVSHPVEVIQSIVNGTQNVLELAGQCDIKSMVYLSSMEVYGNMYCSDERRVSEEEAGVGRVDILSARSCYPLGKRMAENICYSYFNEYGVPVKIARLAQTFGRGVPPSDNRVFSQFARAVHSGEDIVLHTEGRSMGNYCGIDDVISGILTILERGKNGEAYNVVNEENTMTIWQMAQLVASQVAGERIGIRFEIPPDDRYGYAADTGLRLSGKKLRGLEWEPKESLSSMYQNMLEDIR